jgi:hypothetical protein
MVRQRSEKDVDNLSVKWDQLKTVAAQMNVSDINRINGELTTNITQYLNTAKSQIVPADQYNSKAYQFQIQENTYTRVASDYQKNETHYNNRANTAQQNITNANKQYDKFSNEYDKKVWEDTRNGVNIQDLNNKRNDLIHKADKYERESHSGTRSDRVKKRKDRDEANNKANHILNKINYTKNLREAISDLSHKMRALGKQINEAERMRDSFKNSANNERQNKERNQSFAAEARQNKETNQKQASDLITIINNSYTSAKAIHDEIYNKIYLQLQKTSTTGVNIAGIAGQTANSTITTDNQSLPQATSLDTQNSITNNKDDSNTVLDSKNSVNSYNEYVTNPNTSITAKYSYANNAKNTGETANTKSIALKKQADELAVTAAQEKKIADAIALKNSMVSDMQVFINEYINKNLVNISNDFNNFITNLTNKESASQTILNTPLNKTSMPTNIIGNIDASTAERNKKEIQNTDTDKYKFINEKQHKSYSLTIRNLKKSRS